MKCSNQQDPGGFTLIELMVSMAILSIILMMAFKVVDMSRNAIRLSSAKSKNDAIARRVFDQIARDLSQLVVRADARIEFTSKAGNDKLAFLVNKRGLTVTADAGDRPVSLVTYELVHDAAAGERLLRGSVGHNFADKAGDALKLDAGMNFPAVPADNLQPISNNIIRMEVEYLVLGITGITREINAPATTDNLRGIIISIVTMDDPSLHAVDVSRLPDLAAKFTDATNSKNTLETWCKIRDDLAASGLSGLPRSSLRSIPCYQRTFLLQ